MYELGWSSEAVGVSKFIQDHLPAKSIISRTKLRGNFLLQMSLL